MSFVSYGRQNYRVNLGCVNRTLDALVQRGANAGTLGSRVVDLRTAQHMSGDVMRDASRCARISKEHSTCEEQTP